MDPQGWIGSDYSPLWIKIEGEPFSSATGLVDAEVQALCSRPAAHSSICRRAFNRKWRLENDERLE